MTALAALALALVAAADPDPSLDLTDDAAVRVQLRLELGAATASRDGLTTGLGTGAELAFRGVGRGEGSNIQAALGFIWDDWPGDGLHPSAHAEGTGLRLMVRKAFTRAGLRPYLGMGVTFYEFTPTALAGETHFLVPTTYELGVQSRGDGPLDFGAFVRLVWVDPFRGGGRADDPAFVELGVAFTLEP